jgi:hypothetical protein
MPSADLPLKAGQIGLSRPAHAFSQVDEVGDGPERTGDKGPGVAVDPDDFDACPGLGGGHSLEREVPQRGPERPAAPQRDAAHDMDGLWDEAVHGERRLQADVGRRVQDRGQDEGMRMGFPVTPSQAVSPGLEPMHLAAANRPVDEQLAGSARRGWCSRGPLVA